MRFWTAKYLKWVDWRVVVVICALMAISLAVISAHTMSAAGDPFFTPKTQSQLHRFALGWIAFVIAAGLDTQRLREATWILYLLTVAALLGLFFTSATQRVHRWYWIPGIHIEVQPSEVAKVVVVLALSWLLERRQHRAKEWRTAFWAAMVAGLPFILILKQPDLGTALVLWPITLVMFYFGGVNRRLVRWMTALSAAGLGVVALIFLGVIDHTKLRPLATVVLKEYQYERFNPDSHHQRAAATAIALGGVRGTGWRESEYGGQGWLPAAETDSVFPAFVEEFGLVGAAVILALFYALIYFGFQVTAIARDTYGRLLSSGITIYVAMHVLTNIAMMCGFLPITGVPLPLVTYGGSSVLVTMGALGLLQGIYSRRFVFSIA
jgi:rod shape determining protein RodA